MSIIYHSITRVPHAVYQDSLYIVLVEDNGVVHNVDWSYETGLDYSCSDYEYEFPDMHDIQQYNDVIVFLRQFKNTSNVINLLSVKDMTPMDNLVFDVQDNTLRFQDIAFTFEKNNKEGYKITFPNVDSFLDDVSSLRAQDINLGSFFKSALLFLEQLDYTPSMNF